ncbi:methyltransferase domain-containing protein [Stenotrophomonas sp. CFBP8994]|uniref:methyltransferase domain-containing protein n=1 Tax=Stenotrophomonas sp. CFBP8994 TaxID=3096527 RepID=UPI002A6B474D|nr:methyltransferase domain-containing protein [Stenotrophomonas sp. CFBP8994]MDY0980256.1 methyltransferase domain-containing protein [Stenotrophomonas sp. CFBP8994]
MSSSQESLISADEVMRRVRMRLGVGDIVSGGPVSASLTSVVAGATSAPPNAAFKPPTADFKKRDEYVVADFLAYDDLAFITHAYQAILHREPDDSARGHLEALRSGGATKIEILAALRWSPEGLSHGVHIDGLLIPYKLHSWRRIPLLGWVLHWCHTLVRLPRHSRVVDAHISAVSGDLQFFQGNISQVVADQGMRLESQERALQNLPSTEMVDELGQRINVLTQQLAEQVAALHALPRYRPPPREAAVATAPVTTVQAVDASAVDSDLDDLYAAFEDKFRGPQDQIRERLAPYLKFVADIGAGSASAPILDLGCGRGEWLGMLRDEGLQASGVDLNGLFVEECEKKGLQVEYTDALTKLRGLPNASTGMVTLFHLAEHLTFRTLVDLLDEVHRVLLPGGGLIVETPNPENALVAQWAFYMDPTHRNPLPPQMLRWMVQARGFVQSDIRPLFEARGTPEVAFVPEDVPGAATINALVRPLHASRDYAIMARKSVSLP